MIIGLTGQNASGKGEVGKYLEEKGFLYESLSNRIREELVKRSIEESRENLINLANELRERNGSGYLALKTLEKLEENKKYVVDSIRNPDEVNILKTKEDFILINVEAPAEIRFERLKERGRTGDINSLKEFKDVETRENSENASAQRVKDVEAMSEIIINNDSSLDNLHKKLDRLLKDLNKKYPRPSWDEYFLRIAESVGRRATCDRGMFGCVVAKDKHILVTGYVGAPKGLEHCDEVGHQMKTMVHEDGSESMHCVRTTHAEQNAICQAAMLGIPLEGSTLYNKLTPCSTCAKLIINSGIKRVVCAKRYHAGKETEDLFKTAGIELVTFNQEVDKYKNQ
jgi:dCMP deaminase